MTELQRFSSNGVIDPDDVETDFSIKKNKGWHIKTTTGILLIFVALVVSVAVGLIVHFAEKKNGDNGPNVVGNSSPLTSEKLTEKCRTMARSKDSKEICSACPTTSQSTHLTTVAPSAKVNVRLPKALEPISYDLEIRPDLYGEQVNNFTFNGKVKIIFRCLEATNKIVINGHDLEIDKSSITFTEEEPTPGETAFESFSEDKVRQFLIFELTDYMVVGQNYSLEVNFRGPLKPDLKGLYLSSYEEKGQTKHLATTQFQPTDARKAFPCFDEPGFKAKFTITIVRQKGWISLSNLIVTSRNNRENNYVADVYQTSPPMSTYLVAFVVCQFDYISKNTSSGLQFHTWAKPESVEQTREALEVGTRIIDFYENFFDIPYPLPKQDMIAIPDYPLGAMENWGLITYRESRLLYDPDVSAKRNKKSVTITVVHELAHQWFGNLVTMEWWDDLWLNEGFATFMEYFASSKIRPEWRVMELFAVSELYDALEMDGLSSSHPIYVPVSNPDEINEIFDKISYNKGGSIVRMIRFFMGEDTFLRGIQDYLRSRAYKSSNHDDLWSALDKASRDDEKHLPLSIKDIMDTWILQMNYPVVTVTHKEQGKLHVEQKRFLVGGEPQGQEKFTSPFNYSWNIPFTYTTSLEMKFNKTDQDVTWITGKSLDIMDDQLPDISEADAFIIGNTNEYGLYRVNYDEQNWQAIMKQLKVNHNGITVLNRGQIINDAWNLAKAGELDMLTALQSVEYLDKEMDYLPWAAATRELSYMSRMLSKTELYGDLKKFMTSKVEGPFKKLTLDNSNSTQMESYLRATLASLACSFGVPGCVTEAKKIFQNWMADPDHYRVDPDIKSTVYCTGIAEGGTEAWDFAYSQYKKSQVASESLLLLTALGCASETWILNRYLELSLDSKEVRRQDQVYVIQTVSNNIIGRSLAWDFVGANWDYLRQSFGSGFFAFSRLILSVTEGFNTEYDLKQLEQFVSSHPDLGTGRRAFEQAMEKTRSNINWLGQNKAVIKEWLNKQTLPAAKITNVRLPRSVIPSLYEIELLPDIYTDDPKEFKIYGYVKITVQCKEQTTNITLHGNQLVVDDATVKISSDSTNGVTPRFVRKSQDLQRQFLILHLDTALMPGQEYYVEMNYTGPLKDDLAGLYYSSYMEGNDKVYIAVTQMEATDARKVFPCFDEPNLKAKFQITLLRKPNKISLSNMPLAGNESRANGYIADIYPASEKMSTYLVCVIICDFSVLKGITKNNITYGVWAKTESITQAAFGLQVGMETISFYEDFFEIPFPLPKQDMIAIPDFSAGAMENWGLITYRETAVLYEPGVSSTSNKQRVGTVIAHELGHQWFGDLVTMDWWDDLWLNEGFATFMEYMGTNHMFPDWKMFEQFTVNEVQTAFDFDGLTTSHPIYAPVANPAEINEIFDSISYAKGAAIVRMMKFFTGDSTFQYGLGLYLHSRKFGNAAHSDLWRAMKNQSIIDGGGRRTDVDKVMDTWTLQMNYPVVTVNVTSNGKIHLSQKRYLRNPNAKDPLKYTSPYGYVWQVPFTYTTKSSAQYDQTFKDIVWLNGTEYDVPLASNIKPDDWVIGNIQQFGYYRVNYNRDNWLSLIKQLKTHHKDIHVINRGQIINDAWALSKSGDLEMDIALKVIEYLGNEMDYVPWYAAVNEISYVRKMLSRTAVYGKFKNLMKSLVQMPFEKFGMEKKKGDGHIELSPIFLQILETYIQKILETYRFTRSLLVQEACAYGIEECNTGALRMFRDWMADSINNRVDPDLASTVYCSGIAEGGEAEWNFAYNKYKESKVASEKATMMTALACTKETWLLSKYLEMTLNPSEIRKQDGYKVIIAVSKNSIGGDLAWNFVKANFDTLLDMYGLSPFSMKNLLNGISGSLNTPFDLQELRDFQALYPDMGTGTRAFQQVIEKTESNIQWMAKHYETVKAWLDQKLVFQEEEIDVRLPRSVLPELYTLEIYPDIYHTDPSDFTFSGTVHIDVRVVETTDNITMHINALIIDKESLIVGTTDSVLPPGVRDITEDPERQFLIINMDGLLTQGFRYFIKMNYTGVLKDDLRGLYWSSYKRGENNVYIATTQMEATDARKTFPCFDEPDMKARFQITLLRKAEKISLSNMPLNMTETRSDGLLADVYETSEIMSTYLVCFVVCDFNKTTGVTTDGIEYGAWARPESLQQTNFALGVGTNTLTFYETFFGFKYPIPKQDMIAIPDFAAGAMENWGLITYKETAMLFEPGVSSESNRQRVTIVITHELGHQWFGNLVTMQWWDDLWLNEGFATFVEYLGADHNFPDWKMFDQFVVNEVHQAFNFDGLVTSHPIYAPVSNPSQISEIFDSISYAKGGSIVRMMRFFLGEDTFQRGLKLYLTSRQFANAFHDDLWQAMANQSEIDGHKVDVKAIMDTWTLQMNYPVVTVTILPSGNLQIKQKRFLINPNATDPQRYVSPYGYKWTIPFTYTSELGTNFDQTYSDVIWITDTETEIVPRIQPGAWIIANVKEYGYFRVNYDASNWQGIKTQLVANHQVIDPINRAQLINDAWALVKSGELPIETALDTLEYLSAEMDYVPWYAADSELSYVKTMLTRTSLYGKYQDYVQTLVQKPFSLLGLDNTGSDHITIYLRTLIASLACSYEIEECDQKTSEIFKNWMGDPIRNRVNPDLASTVYCAGINQGGEDEWDFGYQQYKSSTVATEKITILSALSCTTEVWLLNRYLELSLNPEEIRRQDAVTVIVAISRNPIGRDLAWEFVDQNWDKLLAEYGGGSFSFSSLISGLTSSFNTDQDLEKLQKFTEDHPDQGTGATAVQQALEKTQTNIQWMRENYEKIEKWLDRNQVSAQESHKSIRLPRSLLPEVYDIELFPDIYKASPDNFSIVGYVKIEMKCVENTRNITLNSNKLVVDLATVKVALMSGAGGAPKVTRMSEDTESQFLVLHLDGSLQKGNNYSVEMNFTGPLKDDLAGLYWSSYERGNNTFYLAATQMQATDARKAFPCFDEPDMKAMFKVTLVRENSVKSLSNMPVVRNETRGNNMVADIYGISPRMSTYLLAFIVGDFDKKSSVTANNIIYSAWSVPDVVNQTEYALDIGVKIITYYEEYFNITFPLPKQDMIGLPDFRPGAMENWGLITYRESLMLYKPGVSSEYDKQLVAIIVAHELAHQWFGNLVTMEWWDDIWLNEGFASFVEYLGTDYLYPEWKMFEQFVFDLHDVFKLDGLVTSHPIYLPVESIEKLHEVFDIISYKKGGCVIRMMQFFLGKETFRRGLHRYLKSREYQNAFHDDLWNSLDEQSHIDSNSLPSSVTEIMNTWILQMNYPVVMVTVTPSNTLHVTQKRFLRYPEAKDPEKYVSPYGYEWWVPFTYTTSNQRKFNQTNNDIKWFNQSSHEITDAPIATAGNSDFWVIGNVMQYGIYVVNYTEQNWKALIKQLNTNHTVIHPINRAQIVTDSWNLAKADQLNMDIALQAVKYLSKERDYIPIKAGYKELKYLKYMLSASEHYGKFKSLMQNLVKDIYSEVGLNDTGAGHLESYIRSAVAETACAYDIPECIAAAKNMFKQWMESPSVNRIFPGVKGTVYCTAIREGGAAEWDFAYHQYKTSSIATERAQILSALSCTKVPWLLQRFLVYAITPTEIPKQDGNQVLSSVASNTIGRPITWDFLQENWEYIVQDYSEGQWYMGAVLKSLSDVYNTQYQLQQIKNFGKQHIDLGRGTTTSYQQAIENVQTNVRWAEKNMDTVISWLNRH